jgi:type I restriction enzyme, S subunit
MSRMPNGWVVASINEINAYKGKNIKPEDFPDQTFELYSVPSFLSNEPELSKGNSIGSSKSAVEEGDVLLCKINPRINRVWLVNKQKELEQIASSEWIVIRQSLIDSNYLRYYFTDGSFREMLCSEVSGVGGSLTRAQPKKVANYPVKIPPFNEQKRIAEKLDQILEEVNSAKARLDKIPTILKNFRRSIYGAATSGLLTKDWRLKYSKGEWQDFSLGDLCVDSFYGPRFGKNEYTKSGVPTIRTTDMTKYGTIKVTDKTPRVEVPADTLDRVKVKKGDLLVTRTGSIGVMAVFDEDYVAIPSAYLIRFRFSKKVFTKYVFFCLMAPKGQEEMGLSSTAITQPNINAGSIKNIMIKLPDINEQQEIMTRVEALLNLADQVEEKYKLAMESVDKITQSLLAKAFRGDLVPQDPNDEPASVLLERIKTEKSNPAKKSQLKKKTKTKTAKIISSSFDASIKNIAAEITVMRKTTKENVLKSIKELKNNVFSFEDIKKISAGDYDDLKTVLFELLDDPKSGITQVFDEKHKAMRFARERK